MRAVTTSTSIVTGLLLMLAPACATQLGSRHQDLSAAQHLGLARSAAAGADAQVMLYQPWLDRLETACGVRSAGDAGGECPLVVTNPTESHLLEAQRLRRVARTHLLAYSALRRTELRACQGLIEGDSEPLKLVRDDAIVGVTPLVSGGARARLVGARLLVRGQAGETHRDIQKRIRCIVAQTDVLGPGSSEAMTSPLGLRGVRTRVGSTAGGFVVDLRSRDPEVAREISYRAGATGGR